MFKVTHVEGNKVTIYENGNLTVVPVRTYRRLKRGEPITFEIPKDFKEV
jgi:hypothetical protein